MKSNRFSQAQIIGILKQGEAGVKVTDLCRQHGISDHTLRLRSGQVYYRWKSKFGGHGGLEGQVPTDTQARWQCGIRYRNEKGKIQW